MEKREDGWQKIEMTYKVPITAKNRALKILVWNAGQTAVYFDDLKIEIRR